MSLMAKAKAGGSFELVPEDQHIARCVLLADIGTHESTYGPKHQCVIGWELPEVLQVYDNAKGQEPAMLSNFYTVSLSEKANLRHALETWRGRAFTNEELDGFDLEKLLAVPCLLSVVHVAKANGDMRAKVNGVTKLHKSMTCPPQHNTSRRFTLDNSTPVDLQQMPEWIQKRIMESSEYPEWCRVHGHSYAAPAVNPAYVEDLSGGANQPDGVPF